jgi:hypothetical protein
VMTINDDLYGAVTLASLPKIIKDYQKQDVPTTVTVGEPVYA